MWADPLGQAAGLRRLVTPTPVRSVALLSGEAQIPQELLLLALAAAAQADGDDGLVVDVTDHRLAALLGLRNRHDLLDWLDHRRSLPAVIEPVRPRLSMISAARGLGGADIDSQRGQHLRQALEQWSLAARWLWLNLRPESLGAAVTMAGEQSGVLLLISPRPGSLAESARQLRALSALGWSRPVCVAMVGSTGESAGQMQFERLRQMLGESATVRPIWAGTVGIDALLAHYFSPGRDTASVSPARRVLDTLRQMADQGRSAEVAPALN